MRQWSRPPLVDVTGLIGRAGAPDTRRRLASGRRPTSSSRRLQAMFGTPVARPTATSLTTRCCEPWCSHKARNRCVTATEGNSLTHKHRSPRMRGAGRRLMWLMWRAAGPPLCVTTINQDAVSGRSLYKGGVQGGAQGRSDGNRALSDARPDPAQGLDVHAACKSAPTTLTNRGAEFRTQFALGAHGPLQERLRPSRVTRIPRVTCR